MKNPIIAVIAGIGVILLVILLPTFMGGVEDTQTRSISDSFNATTGAAATNYTATLSQPLFMSDTQFVSSITSDGAGGDNPLASSYTAATQQLLVTGLDASKARNLTVTYSTDALEDYAGIGTGMTVLPMLGWGVVIFLVVGIMYRIFK